MTALHILHITRAEQLPAWFTEAEAQLQQIAADNGCEAVVLDTTPSVEIAPWDMIADAHEQTYQGFMSLAEKYAPKPFVPKPNCNHQHEYATLNGMMCRDCHQTREASSQFERTLVSRLTPRTNGYVNYGMR